MKTESTYSLQKYSGRNSRHTCPSCGRPHCFSCYVDTDGNILDETVGRCDHESSCGYHKTPKQYFEELPSLSKDWRTQPTGRNHSSARQRTAHNRQQNQQQIKQPICTIPRILLEKSVRKDIPSTFVTFLRTIFPEETVTSLIARYNLGVTRSRDVIYFQVDVKGNIRTGKIMKYNPATGKRVKDPGTPFKINWVHSVMKYAGQLPEDWELTQCLFGEHLLSAIDEKQKTVALVESEKTAIIASGIMPKYIWLATGGKSQLKPEKLSVLKDRKVIAFPDVDGYQEWKEKLSKIEGLTITVSDVLEKNATDKERLDHIDIADWLIHWQQEAVRRTSAGDSIPAATLGTVPSRCHVQRQSGTDSDSLPDFTSPATRLVAPYFPPEFRTALDLLICELDLIPTAIRCADPI